MISTKNSGHTVMLSLERPRSLNALDLEAFELLGPALARAESDPDVRVIVLHAPQGSCPRAFCAGGDVRRLHREFQKSGTIEHSRRFFEAEYRVDQQVWNSRTPIVALTHGITMGGGIGLIRGAAFRVISENSVWAMPEVSIGLYPDVGATFFLAQLPEVWARFIAYCGARLPPRDLLELGLATHFCSESAQVKILETFESESFEGSREEIDALLTRHQSTPPSTSWKDEWRLLETIFSADEGCWDRAEVALQSDSPSPALRQALETMLSGSPLSHRLIARQLAYGRKLPGDADGRRRAFEWEFLVSTRCVEHGDFLEGVRSRLVDKDFMTPGRPVWKFRHPREVPDSLLREIAGE